MNFRQNTTTSVLMAALPYPNTKRLIDANIFGSYSHAKRFCGHFPCRTNYLCNLPRDLQDKILNMRYRNCFAAVIHELQCIICMYKAILIAPSDYIGLVRRHPSAPVPSGSKGGNYRHANAVVRLDIESLIHWPSYEHFLHNVVVRAHIALLVNLPDFWCQPPPYHYMSQCGSLQVSNYLGEVSDLFFDFDGRHTCDLVGYMHKCHFAYNCLDVLMEGMRPRGLRGVRPRPMGLGAQCNNRSCCDLVKLRAEGKNTYYFHCHQNRGYCTQ